jgi:hypothetical protein
MRRLLVVWILFSLGLVWGAGIARAQSDREVFKGSRPAAGPTRDAPLPSVPRQRVHTRLVVPQSPPPAAQAAAPQTQQPAVPMNADARDDRHHHHHGRGASSPWGFWGGGFPLTWGGAYASPFLPVYPVVVDFTPPVNFFVPAPQPPAVPQPGAQDDDAPAKGKPRPTSAEQKAKAGKFIGFGDANFANQKYLAASERYKTAARMAPDLAEPHMRQGHALVAMGQYENAVQAFKRGLRIRSDWSDSPLSLDQLYGPDRLAKTSHIESLAKAVEANPLDSTLLVALGMELYFDAQRDRAALFFARAAQLGGNEDRLLNEFLPKPGPADAPRQPGRKIVF